MAKLIFVHEVSTNQNILVNLSHIVKAIPLKDAQQKEAGCELVLTNGDKIHVSNPIDLIFADAGGSFDPN